MKFAQHRTVYSLHAKTETDKALDAWDMVDWAVDKSKIVFRRPVDQGAHITGNFSDYTRGASCKVMEKLIEDDIAVDYFTSEHLILGVRIFMWEFGPSVRPVTFQLVRGRLKGQCWCPHCNGRGYLGFRAKRSFSPCPALDLADPLAVRGLAQVMGVPYWVAG